MKRRGTLNDSITVPISKPFKLLVSELAKRDDRTPTQFSRRILERAVAEEAQRAGLTEEAKAAGLELSAVA